MKTERFELKVSPEDKEKWKRQAKKDGLSLASFINMAVNQHINKKGV